MAWKGFLTESKLYMNYPDVSHPDLPWGADSYGWPEWNAYPNDPDGWTQADKLNAKIEFWRKFPRAVVRFYLFTVWDWIKAIYYVLSRYNG